jgi:hypothetical protein
MTMRKYTGAAVLAGLLLAGCGTAAIPSLDLAGGSQPPAAASVAATGAEDAANPAWSLLTTQSCLEELPCRVELNGLACWAPAIGCCTGEAIQLVSGANYAGSTAELTFLDPPKFEDLEDFTYKCITTCRPMNGCARYSLLIDIDCDGDVDDFLSSVAGQGPEALPVNECGTVCASTETVLLRNGYDPEGETLLPGLQSGTLAQLQAAYPNAELCGGWVIVDWPSADAPNNTVQCVDDIRFTFEPGTCPPVLVCEPQPVD